jgi:hypothetical protein
VPQAERHGGWHDVWALEKTVVFENGKTTTVDFDWAGANAVVEGTVSFASAKDARLRAEVTGPDDSKLTAYVSVQPDGTFSIPRLFPGRVTLTATRIDQREVAEEISATVDAVAKATVNCNLVPSTTGQ